jgi:hypothetical protein
VSFLQQAVQTQREAHRVCGTPQQAVPVQRTAARVLPFFPGPSSGDRQFDGASKEAAWLAAKTRRLI